MLVGLILAMVYCLAGFDSQTGSDPVLAVSTPPLFGGHLCLNRGRLYVCGIRVHHWMFWLCCLPAACVLAAWNTIAFAIVMVVHGLSYSDRFELY